MHESAVIKEPDGSLSPILEHEHFISRSFLTNESHLEKLYAKAASLFVHPPTATGRIGVMLLLSRRPTKRRPYFGLKLGWLNVTVQSVENIDDLIIVTPR